MSDYGGGNYGPFGNWRLGYGEPPGMNDESRDCPACKGEDDLCDDCDVCGGSGEVWNNEDQYGNPLE